MIHFEENVDRGNVDRRSDVRAGGNEPQKRTNLKKSNRSSACLYYYLSVIPAKQTEPVAMEDHGYRPLQVKRTRCSGTAQTKARLSIYVDWLMYLR